MKPNQRLKRERELRGWSQARVAQEIGTDPASVSRWERGSSFPYPYFREKLCALFGKDAATLGLLQENDEVLPASQADEGALPERSNSGSLEQQIYDPAIPLPMAEATTLVGRDGLLQQLKQRLFFGEPGALTVLHGLPGVGKTALAIALAHDPEVQEHFRAGILWAGVGPTPNRLGLLSRWGALLGITASMGPRTNTCEDWVRAIHAAIGRRQMLLVIDDAWDIEEALAFKVGGPLCAHLLTTRIPQVAVQVAGDGVLEVPELSEQDSLTLLNRFVPDLVAQDVDAVLPLVNAVGGLPLALTLVGKYLRVQAATGQPRRLSAAMRQVYDTSQRLHLSEPVTLVDPHPSLPVGTPLSLHAIIAVSEHYIDERSREALRVLSIFPPKPNSFTEEVALAVCQMPVEVLDTLCDAGLLESRGPRRYALHQTIADYARMHLSSESEMVAAQRLIEYMVHFIESHTTDYNGLEQESRTILMTLELAFERGMMQEYVHGVMACMDWLRVRGLVTIALMHLNRAYDIAVAHNDIATLIAILSHLGQIAMEQGENVQAERYLQEGLALARRNADDVQTSRFLLDIGAVLEQRGEYAQANTYFREGLDLAQRMQQWNGSFSPLLVNNPLEEEMCMYFTELPGMMSRNYLANIDDLFHAWPESSSLSPVIQRIITGPDGHIYGVPRDAYNLCLVYNRRLFAQAGLDPDRPPTTWEEFRSMARQVSRPEKGIYGFAETTIYHEGGWHFTNWLYTADVQAQQQREDGSWIATFNHPKAVELLEMFKAMRFHDGSIAAPALHRYLEIMDLLARGHVAMAVMIPRAVLELSWHPQATFADFGLAPMPQNGGNACLLGGHAYVFPVNFSPDLLKTAFERVTSQRFNEHVYEESLKATIAAGHPVGLPWSHYLMGDIFTGPFREQLVAITLKYVNTPTNNYLPFLQSQLTPIPEPRIEAQKYYALIDPIMQAVLTDPAADPQRLLDAAVQQFQRRTLDHIK